MKTLIQISGILFLLFLIHSCKKQTLEEDNSDNIDSNSFYLKFNLNGKTFEYYGKEYGEHPIFISANGYGPFYQDKYMLEYESSCLIKTGDLSSQFSISFVNYIDTSLLDHTKDYKVFKNYDDFTNIFEVGEKAIKTESYSTDTNGVVIQYFDNSNTYWCFCDPYSNPPINPQNSINDYYKYEIISSGNYFSLYQGNTIVVKANFNCVLYNSIGDSIIIENGTLKSLYDEDIGNK